MKNKGLGCLLIFVVLALLASLLVNLVLFGTVAGVGQVATGFVQPKEHFGESLVQDGAEGNKDKIARIDLSGIISNAAASDIFGSSGMHVESIKRALEQATQDPNVKAIVLRVDSPGGEVTASDNLYNAIRIAAVKKPVIAYMDSIAASGGYYLSCGATRIVANETTLTGSIGVIIQTLNYNQAFGKLGLESLTFVSGNFKDTLSGARPMRDDEKAYIQNLVMQMYDKFVGIVATSRKLDKEALKAGVADGRVVTGKEALDNKLVDSLGYIEDAYALARQLGGAPDAMVVKYEKVTSFADVLGAFATSKAQGSTVKVDVSDRLLPRLEAGHLYLLPAHMAP
jgi:protease IV